MTGPGARRLRSSILNYTFNGVERAALVHIAVERVGMVGDAISTPIESIPSLAPFVSDPIEETRVVAHHEHIRPRHHQHPSNKTKRDRHREARALHWQAEWRTLAAVLHALRPTNTTVHARTTTTISHTHPHPPRACRRYTYRARCKRAASMHVLRKLSVCSRALPAALCPPWRCGTCVPRVVWRAHSTPRQLSRLATRGRGGPSCVTRSLI